MNTYALLLRKTASWARTPKSTNAIQSCWFSTLRGPHRRRAPHSGSNIPAYVWLPVAATTGLIGYAYYAYLDQVPLTERKRWIATSPRWEAHLGDQEYKKLLAHFSAQGKVLPPDHRASRTVQRVGSRIAKAAEKFAEQHHVENTSAANMYNKSPYTYTVVRDETANAFVLPNNHVFVMTGLFRYTPTEDDLAAVLGHEIAHNLARHAGERMSSSFVVNLFARLSLIIDPSGFLMTLMVPATALLRDLPHSRTQEMEADHIGLYLAAEACYDPRAAKRVFTTMKRGLGDGYGPPEFLSTHPSHASRISKMDEWMPKAMKVFKGESVEEDGPSFGMMMGESKGDRCHHVRQQMQMARKDAAYRAAMSGRGI